MSAAPQKWVTLGRVSGVFGIKGWVKVESYTDPPGNIVAFDRWTLRLRGADRAVEIERGHEHGGGVVAKLHGIDDRDRAREFVGAEVVIERNLLPEVGAGEYYWTDLEGLEVRTTAGVVLGTVARLLATGAHDVLVVAGTPERLIPFVAGPIVKRVDLDAGLIEVDWSPDFE